jgi:hypothetical protein
VENGACTFGAQYTAEQYEELNLLEKPVFCFDNDREGGAGLSKMSHLLKKGHWVIIWDEFLKKMNLSLKLKDMNDVAVRIGRKVRWEDLEDCASNDWWTLQSAMF